MKWSILYHHMVEEDLESVGPSAARRIVKALDEKTHPRPQMISVRPYQGPSPISGNCASEIIAWYMRFVRRPSLFTCWLSDPAGTRRFTGPL